MGTIVRRNVADIPEASRKEIENLIGQPLSSDQRIFIILDALYSRAPQTNRNKFCG